MGVQEVLTLNSPWAKGLAKMERFTISKEPYTHGFENNITFDPLKPIDQQLNLRELIIRKSLDNQGDTNAIRSYVERHSSLRINFGWSFESTCMLEQVMQECIAEVAPHFNIAVGGIVSDTRCDWFGFLPLNIFERAAIEDLNLYSLILYNNELINYQQDVVKFVVNHKLFKQHSLIRNDRYRFKYFKAIRRDEAALAEAFLYYVDAVKDTSLVHTIPREILEEQIGCHYLHYPDKFFELLEFTKLKGELYE
jgi:hypothetical protein